MEIEANRGFDYDEELARGGEPPGASSLSDEIFSGGSRKYGRAMMCQFTHAVRIKHLPAPTSSPAPPAARRRRATSSLE